MSYQLSHGKNVASSDNNYKTRNQQVLNEIEAVFEKIQFGIVRVDFHLHNKRITQVDVYGDKRVRFDKQGCLEVNS